MSSSRTIPYPRNIVGEMRKASVQDKIRYLHLINTCVQIYRFVQVHFLFFLLLKKYSLCINDQISNLLFFVTRRQLHWMCLLASPQKTTGEVSIGRRQHWYARKRLWQCQVIYLEILRNIKKQPSCYSFEQWHYWNYMPRNCITDISLAFWCCQPCC
jgi:hypothetical protein